MSFWSGCHWRSDRALVFSIAERQQVVGWQEGRGSSGLAWQGEGARATGMRLARGPPACASAERQLPFPVLSMKITSVVILEVTWSWSG